MALPFRNGFELAQALGFGKLYQASKKRDENNVQMESKTSSKGLIRLTEKDLHNIVKESLIRILRENAWGKYPQEDQTEAMYDMNLNTDTNGEWADAYKRDDPMIKKVKGSTLRDMMSDTMGNKIQAN